ncbi:MAG: TatD family hydrolase [Bacteroidota bacterium]
MEFVDTHAHLYAPAFAKDIQQVVARSRDQQVCKIYMPNINADTIENMVALENRYPDLCAAMIGIHPCYIDHSFEKQLAQVEAWLAKHPFIGIGEIGIDLYRAKTYQAQQAEALAIQLIWAQQYRLPVVIHCREGMEITLQLLEKYQDGRLKGIFHCFGGSLKEAERIIELGFYIGVGGMVTFKNAGLDRTVAAIGLEHLVLETDAPYLAPTPYRGKRNEPAYLFHIASKIAEIKASHVAMIAQVTTANARSVFKKANCHTIT